jgi:hypothetical protein
LKEDHVHFTLRASNCQPSKQHWSTRTKYQSLAAPALYRSWIKDSRHSRAVVAMMATAVDSDGVNVSNPTLTVRTEGGDEYECDVRSASEQLLRSALPWRTFRWYFGQRHYSGNYWAATMKRSLIYESRLEQANLMLADFDPDVAHIVSQPFLMRAVVNGKVRRHVPDFLLFRPTGITVVDVKPVNCLAESRVEATFAWVKQVVEARGWTFQVASEPDRICLANVRFLAGFRNPTGISAEILDLLTGQILVGRTLAESTALVDAPAPCVRAALFHMLWRHDVSADMTRPLSSRTVLEIPK